MLKINTICFIFIILIIEISSFLDIQFSRQNFHLNDGDFQSSGIGKPLFLTPLIEKGLYKQAKDKSQVKLLQQTNTESFSGFLTVNKKYNSNIFFWFFPAKINKHSTPILLWLQGGPGGSSLFGLFCENGPFYVTENYKLLEREYSWTNKYSMLYIDNPVGTGFSFTSTSDGYAKDQNSVATDLYNALTQFFKMFNEYSKNEFYITGESYAGKYIPAIGFKIMTTQPFPGNFKGVAIGDGWTDPITMIPAYSALLYNIDLIDDNEKKFVSTFINGIIHNIQNKNWHNASLGINNLTSIFIKLTGFNSYYNHAFSILPKNFDYYPTFINQPEIRNAIHVGNLTYNSGEDVAKNLFDDIPKSTKKWLAELMNNYRVLLYNGQLDIIVGSTLTETMLKTVKWKGQNKYVNVVKSPWKLDKNSKVIDGYIKNVDEFYQAVVIGGGHILPYDQPQRCFELLHQFFNKTLKF